MTKKSFLARTLVSVALALPTLGMRPAAGPSFNVNDVSILYPLPRNGEQNLLLGPRDAGALGAILPYEVYALAPTLTEGGSRQGIYDSLRVVGVRIDPCFARVDLAAADCLHQVRLVLQPLVASGPDLKAVDVAIHVFYVLPPADFTAVAQGVLRLKLAAALDYSGTPLAVHPVLKAEGLQGAFAAGLRDLLLSHIGFQRLTRMTFLQKIQSENSWNFGLFDRQGDEFTASVISTLDDTIQNFMQAGSDVSHTREGVISPQTVRESPLDLLSSDTVSNLPEDAVTRGLEDLLKIENPAFFSPNTLDCASCHVAGNTRRFVEALPGVLLPGNAFRFVAPPGQVAVLADETNASGNSLGAFRYFNRLVAVSQRTVNESTLIADFLSATVTLP